jgi:hypothetical protein
MDEAETLVPMRTRRPEEKKGCPTEMEEAESCTLHCAPLQARPPIGSPLSLMHMGAGWLASRVTSFYSYSMSGPADRLWFRRDGNLVGPVPACQLGFGR